MEKAQEKADLREKEGNMEPNIDKGQGLSKVEGVFQANTGSALIIK